MKYMLMKTFMSSGKKVFYNERQGGSYLYVAEVENHVRQQIFEFYTAIYPF